MTVLSRERSRSRPWLQPGLAAGHEEGGRHADVRRAGLGGEAPLEAEVGPGGVAVDEDDRRAQDEHRHERVPHHPRGRRELQQALLRPDVPLQAMGLEVLDEQVPVPVHDRLGQAGRPGREQHHERVVERHLLELQRPLVPEQLGPLDGVGDHGLAVGDVHDVLDGRQRLAELRDLLRPVQVAVAEPVPADGEEDLRLDLGEAVDDAARAELRRARRPRRAEARGGDEGDHGLGDVGQVADDAVARADTEAQQPPSAARDLLAQLPERQRHRLPGLRARHDRDAVLVLARAEHVLGVVQPRLREPLRARHLVRREDLVVRLARLHVEELPQRGPEALEVVDGPAPQLVPVGEVTTVLVAHPVQIPTEGRTFAHIARGVPEDPTAHRAREPTN